MNYRFFAFIGILGLIYARSTYTMNLRCYETLDSYYKALDSYGKNKNKPPRPTVTSIRKSVESLTPKDDLKKQIAAIVYYYPNFKKKVEEIKNNVNDEELQRNIIDKLTKKDVQWYKSKYFVWAFIRSMPVNISNTESRTFTEKLNDTPPGTEQSLPQKKRSPRKRKRSLSGSESGESSKRKKRVHFNKVVKITIIPREKRTFKPDNDE